MLGERNRALEEQFAATIPDLAGPLLGSALSFEQAATETLRLLRETSRPVRRPVLCSADGLKSASPAFILRERGALVIRDVRLAHRPETRRDNRVRVAFAGWLARELTGLPVARLELVNGLGQVVEVAPEPDEELARLTARTLELLGDAPEPDLLLAHSHCQHCDHYTSCWDRAEAEHRIEVVPAVTRARAGMLHAEGVRTFDELAARSADSFRARELREAAGVLLSEARAFATGAPVWLRDPALPRGRTPVWFDVESDAEGERAEVPVYLWGLAVERAEPQFEPIVSELTPEGDRDAWQRFVARALEVFHEHPDAVWVHWHLAEPMWLDRYIARLGAPAEFVERMRAPGALLDLHRALERCVRLPLRSTSVKFVAPWLGFKWSNPDADAAWSTAQLHRARASSDPAERAALLAEVARYNADDLWAMRTVWKWLEGHAG
jgi:predicted RecB family nuclease